MILRDTFLIVRRISFILFVVFIAGCKVYSFSGATIEGKTINIHVLENRAANINPTLAPSLNAKIRSRILSQTGLAPINTDAADYDISGAITNYAYSYSSVQNTQVASQSRLTISVEITFKNRLDTKSNFTQTFTRFTDFPASSAINAVEAGLTDAIGSQLADDVFNKAFVNW